MKGAAGEELPDYPIVIGCFAPVSTHTISQPLSCYLYCKMGECLPL